MRKLFIISLCLVSLMLTSTAFAKSQLIQHHGSWSLYQYNDVMNDIASYYISIRTGQYDGFKITVEYNNLHETFEGNADETIKALMQYIHRVYPELEIISKLLWKPDIQKILDLVSEYAKLNVEGDIIFGNTEFRNLAS